MSGEPKRETRYPLEPATLMELGFGAELQISIWNGQPNDIPDFGVKVPKSVLIPKRHRSKFLIIRDRLRENFSRYCYRTAAGYFLPFKAYGKWRRKHDIYSSRFANQTAMLLSEYDSIQNLVGQDASGWIEDIYRRVTEDAGAPAYFAQVTASP